MTRISQALARHRDRVKNGEEGFTLIELLVVVIIIGILAAIAIPVYIGVQNNAKDSAVKTDLTNAKTAVVAWYTDNGSASAAPALTDPVYKSLGFTKSAETQTITLSGGAMDFCIQALGKTGKTFSVDASGGVKEAACA